MSSSNGHRQGPRLLVLQHGADGPPGLLGEWATARGITMEIRQPGRDELPDPSDYDALATLGSKHTPQNVEVPAVAAEIAFLEQALAAEIPILGLCFGGQMLAHVLGGAVELAPEPELGWQRVRSADPEQIPEGPWLQWHFYRFIPPAQATLLADSPVGAQAFRQGRHLGVQFHPEATIEIVEAWAEADAVELATRGIHDGQARLEQGRAHATAAAENAFALFDAFWRQVPPT